MHYVSFVCSSYSGNEAVLTHPIFCVHSSESCVKCEVLCHENKEDVMKVALLAVKRIQCMEEAQIQLALWAP